MGVHHVIIEEMPTEKGLPRDSNVVIVVVIIIIIISAIGLSAE